MLNLAGVSFPQPLPVLSGNLPGLPGPGRLGFPGVPGFPGGLPKGPPSNPDEIPDWISGRIKDLIKGKHLFDPEIWDHRPIDIFKPWIYIDLDRIRCQIQLFQSLSDASFHMSGRGVV